MKVIITVFMIGVKDDQGKSNEPKSQTQYIKNIEVLLL